MRGWMVKLLSSPIKRGWGGPHWSLERILYANIPLIVDVLLLGAGQFLKVDGLCLYSIEALLTLKPWVKSMFNSSLFFAFSLLNYEGVWTVKHRLGDEVVNRKRI